MADVTVHPECPFSEETFNLLAQLDQDFYIAHEAEFKKYVEQPLQKLCRQVAAQLPNEIIKRLELKVEAFQDSSNKICLGIFYDEITRLDLKNDFAQLFIYIDSNRLIFGLLIPDETNGKKRFIENLKTSFNKEIIFQNTSLPDNCELHFSSSGKSLDPINPLGEWLKLLTRQNSRTKDIQASVHLEPNEVLLYSSEQLASQIKQTFESLFILFLTANFDDPIDEIRHYLNSNNNTSAERYLERGIIHYRENNYQRSIKRFNTAIERAPNLADAYSYRGQAKAELGDIEGAISDYNQLLLIQPKNSEAYYNRGNAYHKLKDYDTAIQDYNQALNINSNFALAHYHRGLTYLALENQERAIEDLCRAVELFEQEKDMDKSEEAQSILQTIQLDYSEPSFTEICQSVRYQGLRISESTLRRYHLALKSRKFVILSGISGTGKTWLTKAYADAVEAEYLLVPVAPNWMTNEDLLGYLSPIDNKYHDTDFSTFLEKAEAEYQQAQVEKRTPKPYHLVLDEMNLARVEYYFAKFLSVMEVRMREGVAQIQLAPDKQVLLTPNLYFIGTVNVDETTHSFADKVYDRAQLIELEAPRQDLYEHLGDVPYREILMKIWDEVHTVAPFAFRVIDEIKTYVEEAEALNVSWQNALDEQLLQKILPKFKGTDDRVGVALQAFVDIVNDKDFPLSHKKATKMLETFNQHGFTSYF
ncbi:MAG: tetratricopeptide repeat protein [Coleofasciculus chthonoplastes F3-SA18-01]|uniref:McrB family protein n=1 Tax=Coleofasciculus chthonoplastes TaxID=64178 RepID=UPI0032FF8E4D